MPRILRWKGGYAGDMIMYMMHLSGYKIANVRFLDQVSGDGRVSIDFDHTSGPLTEIQRIALEQRFREHMDQDRLCQQIRSCDDVWIKSHYYTNKFDDITTDILADAQSLPFVISANIHKTDTMKYLRFHPLTSRLRDPEIKIKLAFYNVGKDSMDAEITSACSVNVSAIISGWNRLIESLTDVGVYIDHSCQEFYEHWVENNRQYFPSAIYIDMVNKHDYDWKRLDIAAVERYALLVLSQEKFKIL